MHDRLAIVSWPLIRAVDVGFAVIPIHSLSVLTGSVSILLLIWWRARRQGLWTEALNDAMWLTIPGAFIGARLGWYVWSRAGGVRVAASELLTLRFTDLSTLGGLAGIGALFLSMMRLRRQPVWPLVGLLAEAIACGVAIMRVGDVIGGYHLGRRTATFVGYRVPDDVSVALPGTCQLPGDVCHPVKLYELVLLMTLLIGAWHLRRIAAPDHRIAVLILAGYGSGRAILVEPLSEAGRIALMTTNQFGALGLLGLGLWVAARGRGAEHPRSAVFGSETAGSKRSWRPPRL